MPTSTSGDERWQGIDVTGGDTYGWPARSTYIANPPYFEGMTMTPAAPADIDRARPLAIFGDSITTDHISPAGSDQARQPGRQLSDRASGQPRRLQQLRRAPRQPRSDDARHLRQHPHQQPMLGSRGRHHQLRADRRDHADLRRRDALQGGRPPLVVIAGKEYGTGSSRDWAAKGTILLGVRAVIAESFERIHRSNLVGMGVLPLQFREARMRETSGSPAPRPSPSSASPTSSRARMSR